MSLLKVQESSLDVCVPWIHHVYLLSLPLAVTLPFYYSLLIHLQLIFKTTLDL